MSEPSPQPCAPDYGGRFAAACREHREQLGHSQATVAREMCSRGFNFHQTTVARIEAGERPARLSEAVTLAEILFIDLAAFSGPREDREQPSSPTPIENELEHVSALHDDARIRRLLARGANDDAARERAWAEEVLNQARMRWAAACKAEAEAATALDLANFEVSRLAERIRELLEKQGRHRLSAHRRLNGHEGQ